jgi:hypothetical protein
MGQVKCEAQQNGLPVLTQIINANAFNAFLEANKQQNVQPVHSNCWKPTKSFDSEKLHR